MKSCVQKFQGGVTSGDTPYKRMIKGKLTQKVSATETSAGPNATCGAEMAP